MDPHEGPQPKFKELIKPLKTQPELTKVVETFLTPDQKKVLGDNAAEFMSDALLYLTAFAPSPGSFDRRAVGGVLEIPSSETAKVDAVVDFSKSIGYVDEKPSTSKYNPDPRLEIIDIELHDKLKTFWIDDE